MDTCLIVGLSAFDDHFNHGFAIIKNVEHRAKSGKLRVRRDIVSITQIKIVVLCLNFSLVLGVFDVVSRDEFPRT